MESSAERRQVAGKSETLYQHVSLYKNSRGELWRSLTCQIQKRKRYASGHDHRGQITNVRPLGESSENI